MIARYAHKSVLVALAVMLSVSFLAKAQIQRNDPCPDIKAQDINGNLIDTDTLLNQERDMVLLFFFSVNTSEKLALKLNNLNLLFGGKEIEIIALGLEDEQEALKEFAEALKIKYYIISKEQLTQAAWRDQIDVLPMTLFVYPADRSVKRVVRGVSRTALDILTHVAEEYYQQRKTDKAIKVAEQAVEAGEDAAKAKAVEGYSLIAQGKLDEAEKEFGEIDSKTGLAKVAYEKGDMDTAVALADEAANDGYAQTIKGQALLKSGKVDEAAATLSSASEKPAARWQQSENINMQGRIAQQQGDADAAVDSYQKAVEIDPYNVVALSNEGAVYREKGDLEKAQQVLDKASKLRQDDMVALMLQQVQQELKEANDLRRSELIQAQIADLSARYKEMQASGNGQPKDDWTTRPVILAFLPSANQAPVFFERAGTDIVLQREIEARLQADDRVSVVERAMLDKLLQELSLGSSDLTDPDTQRRLGNVLSAGALGFMDFAQVGNDILIYLRMVDTETTGITFQTSQAIDEDKLLMTVEALVAKLLDNIADDRELRGLIADASSDDAVVINLGAKHGVAKGMSFTAYVEGDPIQAGGKIIAYRQKPVAKLNVITVEQDYAICEVSSKRNETPLKQDMKIKAAH